MPEFGESNKVLLGRYEVGRLLGCGAFAKVYHARHVHTGHSVALKVINKRRLLAAARGRCDAFAAVIREVDIMRRLRHPHVVRLYELLASRTKIYLVVEYVKGGELFARLADAGRFTEEASRKFFRQLVSAVGHCHARGVSHRDLKPENLLLDHGDNLKVSDFGLGALPDTTDADGLLHTLCGTPAYVAPEILAKKGYNGHAVDIWSCGVILFVLNAGYLPFNDVNIMKLYHKIYRGEFRCPRWFSPELKQLMSRLLDIDPETRITVDEIVEDPWFRKGFNDKDLAMFKRFHFYEPEEEEKKTPLEDNRELNAFDLISFSSGADLSGLFGSVRKQTRFASTEPAETVLSRAEELGREKELVVKRVDGREEVVMEGNYGNLEAKVVVRRLPAGLVVVEVVESAGDGDGKWTADLLRKRLGQTCLYEMV